MPTLRWGICTPNRRNPEEPLGFAGVEELEAFAAHAEACGADQLAMGEGVTVFEDSFVYLAACARVTRRIQLGHAVMVPSIRHPAVLANSFSTLQRLSKGRAYNCTGTGAIGRRDLGLRPVKAAELERYCQTVTALTAGEEVQWGEERFKMRWGYGRVPLYIAAEGPKALAVAGRIGDGALVASLLTPSVVRFVEHHIGTAAAEVGRSAAGMEIWYQTRIYFSASVEEALYVPEVEQYLSRWLNHIFIYSQGGSGTPADNLRAARGIDLDDALAERLRMFNEEYSHEDATAGRYRSASNNVKLLDKYDLRHTLGQQGWITGRHEDIVARLSEVIDAGAYNFMCPYYRPPEVSQVDWLDRMGAVFEELRGAPAHSRLNRRTALHAGLSVRVPLTLDARGCYGRLAPSELGGRSDEREGPQ